MAVLVSYANLLLLLDCYKYLSFFLLMFSSISEIIVHFSDFAILITFYNPVSFKKEQTNSEYQYSSLLVGLLQNEGCHHNVLPGWSNFCQPCKYITRKSTFF